MKINALEMEWTDEGCRAVARGFEGVLLTCPRCQEPLPREGVHICGIVPEGKMRLRKSKLTVAKPRKIS